jgi:PKD repeat protein
MKMQLLHFLRSIRKLIFSGIFVFLFVNLNAQQYNAAGTAVAMGNPGCYQITNALSQAGAVWNIYMIDLTLPFDITLTLNFGNRPDIYWDNGVLCGGDGMSFVLQPLSAGVFGLGAGVGFQGINPSLGVVMDTYHFNPSDPPGQHISMNKNGDVLNGSPNELVPTTAAIGFPANITDGLDHLFRFTWTPIGGGIGIINVYFGNATTLPAIPTLTYSGDIVNSIFGGNPNVYWGVAGSTGGCWNLQTVCMTTVANFSFAPNACEGAPVNFTSNSISGLPITDYYWDFGDGTISTLQNPTHTFSPGGTYGINLTITNSGGFTSTMTHSIEIYPKPDVLIAATIDTLCQGDTTTLTATGASTYIWMGGLGTNPIIDVVPPDTTTYTVIGTSTFGCADTTSIVIIVNPNPILTLTATPSNICEGGSSILSANSTVYGTTYSWMPGSLTGDSITVAPAAATTYTVVGDANGCTGMSFLVVDIYPPLVISVSPLLDSICAGSSIALTASGADVYSWTPTSSLSSPNGTTVTATPQTTTTYTVLGTDIAGCTASTTATIITLVGPPISVTATRPIICPGDSSRLSVALNAQSYNWTPPLSLSNPAGQFTYAKPNVTTTYTVEAVNNGCTSTTEFTLGVSSAPVVNFTSDEREGCVGLVVHFQDLSLPVGAAWYWSFGNDTTVGGTSIMQNPYHQFNEIGSYDVTLTVTASGGCSSDTTFEDYIIINPKPTAKFEAKPQRTNILDALVFFHDLSINAYTWTWYFDDNDVLANNSHLQNPTHEYSHTGTFYPSLVVFNQHGCSDSTGLTIIIDPNIAYYMPNAFSPVGNNNQYFTLYGEGIDVSTFEMRIYNRWGEQVCYSRDLDKGWDGRSKSGKMCEQGIYTYLVQFNDVLKRYHEMKGAVMLVK